MIAIPLCFSDPGSRGSANVLLKGTASAVPYPSSKGGLQPLRAKGSRGARTNALRDAKGIKRSGTPFAQDDKLKDRA